MSEFIKKNPEELKENLIKLINRDWAPITVRDEKSGEIGTMTASWGCFGELWNKPVFICYIRPQRNTYGLAANAERLSLCFFDEKYRDQLKFCGTKSGRNTDKVKETGLTPAFTEDGVPYFEEARLVLVCKKLYAQDLNESSIIEEAVKSNYNGDDYHRMYVSEIVSVLKK